MFSLKGFKKNPKCCQTRENLKKKTGSITIFSYLKKKKNKKLELTRRFFWKENKMLYIHEMEGKFKVFFFFFSNSKFWGDIRGGRKKKRDLEKNRMVYTSTACCSWSRLWTDCDKNLQWCACCVFGVNGSTKSNAWSYYHGSNFFITSNACNNNIELSANLLSLENVVALTDKPLALTMQSSK